MHFMRPACLSVCRAFCMSARRAKNVRKISIIIQEAVGKSSKKSGKDMVFDFNTPSSELVFRSPAKYGYARVRGV